MYNQGARQPTRRNAHRYLFRFRSLFANSAFFVPIYLPFSFYFPIHPFSFFILFRFSLVVFFFFCFFFVISVYHYTDLYPSLFFIYHSFNHILVSFSFFIRSFFKTSFFTSFPKKGGILSQKHLPVSFNACPEISLSLTVFFNPSSSHSLTRPNPFFAVVFFFCSNRARYFF